MLRLLTVFFALCLAGTAAAQVQVRDEMPFALVWAGKAAAGGGKCRLSFRFENRSKLLAVSDMRLAVRLFDPVGTCRDMGRLRTGAVAKGRSRTLSLVSARPCAEVAAASVADAVCRLNGRDYRSCRCRVDMVMPPVPPGTPSAALPRNQRPPDDPACLVLP